MAEALSTQQADQHQTGRHFSGPLFYGWWIVAVAFVVSAFGWSTRASFAAIYVAMLDDLGWSRVQAVFGYGLSWLLLAIFAPLSGWLYDRLGPRVVVPAGGISLALGLIFTSLAQEPWQYYLSFGPLVGFGIAATLNVSNALISRWFVRRRGTALGVVTAGSSLGTILSLPLVAQVVAVTGWREALVWYGIILLVGLVPLPAILYRRSPQAIGLIPDGRPDDAARPVRLTSERCWSVWEAIRTPTFWGCFVMLFLGVVAYQILTTHQVAHAADRGIDPITASFVFGLAGVYQFAGNLLGGTLSDRWGRQAVFLVGSLLGLLAIGALATVSGPEDLWKLHVFALAVGIGFGARISLLSAIPADSFGGPSFGLILGLLQAGSGLGGFVGPIIGGFVYDVTASYAIAFAMAAAAVLLSGVAVWFARPPKQGRSDQPSLAPGPAPEALDPASWMATRYAEEAYLAQELVVWSRWTADTELAEMLEITAARARERAFWLRRLGAPPSEPLPGPPVSECWGALSDLAHFDHLRPLLERYAVLPAEPPEELAALLAGFQASEREALVLLGEQIDRLRDDIARTAVRRLPGKPVIRLESDRVYWKWLQPADGGLALARITQLPVTAFCLRPSEAGYLIFVLSGGGTARTTGTAVESLCPGQVVEIPAGIPVEIAGDEDQVFVYLVIGGGLPKPEVDAAALSTNRATSPHEPYC